ncbi:NADH-quinone oxidoreductase subunit C [Sphingomonas sp. DG1-23]|uniref:NADH-quinone oxidoreductase subunit C n=1 Tax=Sphingomonas sp. DG1-23 TaxID=3068316 RepID=UPI00273E2522|nr:NADH-quinone oxidoreductase subunit C [Sphingomonas sp. DG1-23]MDP5278392.1 NADH-quinone oxidoreductase subunit C [Sphingomonas sp. DG1-23]
MRAPAPRYAPNDGVIATAEAALGGMLVESKDAVGEVSLTVARESLVPAMLALRDTPGLEYQQLSEIAGADYPSRAERFDVVYQLLSFTRNHRIRVRVTTDEEKPVPSVTGIWPVAGWLEREVYDMYGVLFDGNTDLRRILTDYGFVGHPLRKDFPQTGYVELRYSEEAKRVVYEPVSLAQDFRNFDFMSPWEGAAYVLPGDEKAVPGPGPADTPQAKPAAPAPAPVDAPKVPEAKGAPTPLSADEIQKADAPATKAAKPRAKRAKTDDSTASTGAGENSPGNRRKSKPKDPDVVPSKGEGQNE